MKALFIAQIAHAINAAYCLSLGDTSQVAWDEAPEWQQQSALAGVEMHLANPDATPEQSHESWLAQKVADGWVYGEVKDEVAKTHHCCLPYDQLPPEQKAKDYLFRAVVHAVKHLPDPDDLLTLQAQLEQAKHALASAPSGGAGVRAAVSLQGVAVQYVGHKIDYTDRLYGSGLLFQKGEVKVLPGELARQLLRHGDLFVRATEEQAAQVDPAETAKVVEALGQKASESTEIEQRERTVADLQQQIGLMDLAALNEIGSRYGLSFSKSKGLARARAELSNKVDQLGII